MKLIQNTLLAFCLAGFGSAVIADDMTDVKEDQAKLKYKQTKAYSKAEYEAAKESCEVLSGNAKDVCIKDAKAKYKTEKATAKATKKSEKAQIEAEEDSAKAHYKAARERCDTLMGAEKDACIASAKLAHPK